MSDLFKGLNKIYLASDHAGVDLKAQVLQTLKDRSVRVEDLGPATSNSVDYPDFAQAVCRKVIAEPGAYGVLICGSGQGMAMSANKFSAIRAALCWNTEVARLSRQHNDANVLCLGARILSHDEVMAIVDTFFSTDFEGGRHLGRVVKMGNIPKS